MARKKGKPIGPIQRLYDREQVANDQSHLTVITPEQRAKGTYSEGRRIVNNHDPVARWKASGRLTQGQELAIELCVRLWNLAGRMAPVTARYDVPTPAGPGVESRVVNEVEARNDLHRIRGYVPTAYFDLFENVVRHGEPAEIAGLRLNFGGRSAADRAHQVVCFVADIIAMKERV